MLVIFLTISIDVQIMDSFNKERLLEKTFIFVFV